MTDSQKYLDELKTLEQEQVTPMNTFARASALWNLGRYSEAAARFSERAAMHGSAEEVYCSLWLIGECFRILGKPSDEVAGALYRAYFYRPTRLEALVLLCKMFRSAGRYDESYRLSMIHPSRPSDLLLLDPRAEWQILEEHALAAYSLDHVDEAKEYFELVAGYNLPDDDRKRIEENIRITSEKPPEEVLTGFENAAKVIFPVKLTITSPEDTANRQNLALAEKQAEADPTPANFLNLSLAYYNVGQPVDCIAAARKAIQLKPDYALAYNNIAAAHLKMAEWDAAIAAANEALKIDPNFQLAKNNRAAAEEKRGHRKKTSK